MAGRSWDDPWHQYPESRPLPAVDGIATSKQRGAMASTWWSKRFIDVLDSYGLGTRMQRGRRYARSGQVLSLEVTPGLVVAQVQGSPRTPYLVSIRAAVPSAKAWTKLQDALQARIGFVARLLDGEVPSELEDACADAGIALFPSMWSQLTPTCNCPDWENPCKHLAAVLYVFADQLDDDPWLLFTWRGRTRDELLAHLDALSPAAGDHGLPAWWPLLPGRTQLDRVRWQSPTASPPDPAHRVLDRLAPLDLSHADTPIEEHLVVAYLVLTDPDHGGDTARDATADPGTAP
jgi:uncharacterized Zn finger protein